jgi:hypothetical protein
MGDESLYLILCVPHSGDGGASDGTMNRLTRCWCYANHDIIACAVHNRDVHVKCITEMSM